MSLYLLLLVFTGGGARSDIQSLVILRPVSAMVLGYALWGMTWDRVRPFRFLIFFAIAVAVLVVIHLIPLPPAIWMSLPGRELVAEVDRAAGLGLVWRPISMIPSQTWNALYSLIIPFAMLALMLRLTREQRFALIPVLILTGILSGLIGLFQIIGTRDNSLYFYNITNYGSAVGLFANRNHQAVMISCLFPLLVVYMSTGLQSENQFRLRTTLAGGAALFLIPLILVTGSRAGLIVGIFGLVSSVLIYRRPQFLRSPKRKIRRFKPEYLVAGALLLGIVLLSFAMSRAEAFDRLFTRDGIEDLRFTIWPLILEMSGKYFPVGSGIGTFAEVYQIDEPLRLLDQSYLNHAHNDWLEIVMTGGLLALALAGIATIVWFQSLYFIMKSRNHQGRDIVLGKLGASIVFMLGIATIADYPLRVPSLMGVFVIAVVWMASGRLSAQGTQGASDDHKNKGGAD